ncbi:MAG: SRPBCC family protein, partial [Hyphomicrobiales bacterium]
MPKFETTRIVSHSAEKMFALVADVESYPQFVPLCQRLSVRGREK